VDLAIRVGDLADSRLISKQLAPHRVGLFASPDYIARRGMPQHPGELAKHECVNFRYQSTGQSLRWPFRDAQGITEFLPKPGITADVSDAVAAVMVAGGGIGMSPTYLSSMYVKRGLLVQVLPEHSYDRSSITALWPESRRDNPNVRAFLKFLVELVPSPAPWDRYLAEARRVDTVKQEAV
jgi:DNA-binding transcriptional LysR family regulator